MNRKETTKFLSNLLRQQVCTVQMIKSDDGHYVPMECCTMTNPGTSGGVSVIDDVDLPCGADCGKDCNECVIQRIMDEYAEITQQIN